MLYTLRAVYLLLHFVVASVLISGYCLLRPRHINNTTNAGAILSWALPVLGIRMIRDQAPPPVPQGQAIYVPNHQSILDVFICTGMLPPKIAILGKSSLRYMPLFGLAFWLAGNIFIDRKNKAKAWETMNTLVNTIKQRGCSLFIFPEGTRSNGQGLLPFKTGAFTLAIQSGLPIIPMVFSSTHKNIDLHRWAAGTVKARYLEPISTEGMTEQDIKPLMELTRNRIQDAIQQLDKEVAELQRPPHKFGLGKYLSRYLKSR